MCGNTKSLTPPPGLVLPPCISCGHLDWAVLIKGINARGSLSATTTLMDEVVRGREREGIFPLFKLETKISPLNWMKRECKVISGHNRVE